MDINYTIYDLLYFLFLMYQAYFLVFDISKITLF